MTNAVTLVCPSGGYIDPVEKYCLEWKRNKPLELVVSVVDPVTGQPFPLQGATARFRVSDAAGNTKFDKDSTINGSDVRTIFLVSDWGGLEIGEYPFEGELVDPINGPAPLLDGSFKLTGSLFENPPAP